MGRMALGRLLLHSVFGKLLEHLARSYERKVVRLSLGKVDNLTLLVNQLQMLCVEEESNP
jgi:hypothetical protein